jgi:opacity protein-like surface antigen
MCLAPAAQAATSAQNANSIYAGVLGGVTLVPDIAIKQLGTSQDLEMDAGFNFGGVIGYKWAFGLRAEGEISYRRNDNDKFAGVPIDGNVNALTFMGNAWYDFHTGTAWLPYVGGGLGVARVAADASVLGIQIVDDNDTVFAWQVGGGIGYEVSPGIVVSADYRYLATTDPSMTDGGGIDFDAEYSSHNIMIGVRGHF